MSRDALISLHEQLQTAFETDEKVLGCADKAEYQL